MYKRQVEADVFEGSKVAVVLPEAEAEELLDTVAGVAEEPVGLRQVADGDGDFVREHYWTNFALDVYKRQVVKVEVPRLLVDLELVRVATLAEIVHRQDPFRRIPQKSKCISVFHQRAGKMVADVSRNETDVTQLIGGPAPALPMAGDARPVELPRQVDNRCAGGLLCVQE